MASVDSSFTGRSFPAPHRPTVTGSLADGNPEFVVQQGTAEFDFQGRETKTLSQQRETRRKLTALLEMTGASHVINVRLPDIGEDETISGDALSGCIRMALDENKEFKEAIEQSGQSTGEIADVLARRLLNNDSQLIGFRHNSAETSYLTTQQLGKGGMGFAYRGFSNGAKMELVIKLPNKETGAARFNAECAVYADPRLANSSFAPRYAASMLDTKLQFLATEYLDGSLTVDDVLEVAGSRQLSKQFKDSVVLSSAEAIRTAHEQGLVHSDIKGGNLLLLTGAEHQQPVRLIDYGTARFLDAPDDVTRFTQTGMGIGTLRHAPLSQLMDAKHRNLPVDVYAFGTTIYQIYAQQELFDSQDALLEERVSDKALARLGVLAKQHPEIAVLILKMVQDDLGLLPNMQEVCEALRVINAQNAGGHVVVPEKLRGSGKAIAAQVVAQVQERIAHDSSHENGDDIHVLYSAIREVHPDFQLQKDESLGDGFVRYLRSKKPKQDAPRNGEFARVFQQKIFRDQRRNVLTWLAATGASALGLTALGLVGRSTFNSSRSNENGEDSLPVEPNIPSTAKETVKIDDKLELQVPYGIDVKFKKENGVITDVESLELIIGNDRMPISADELCKAKDDKGLVSIGFVIRDSELQAMNVGLSASDATIVKDEIVTIFVGQDEYVASQGYLSYFHCDKHRKGEWLSAREQGNPAYKELKKAPAFMKDLSFKERLVNARILRIPFSWDRVIPVPNGGHVEPTGVQFYLNRTFDKMIRETNAAQDPSNSATPDGQTAHK